MSINKQAYLELLAYLRQKGVTLVAVSKTKPVEDILALYQLGQRDFGENYVQELVEKAKALPADIRWHFIGHLQTNKVKAIAPFVHLIHGIDSAKLLGEVEKQAVRQGRIIDVLLQAHIAREETKFGLDEAELRSLLQEESLEQLTHVRIRGLMGMASFTEDQSAVRAEFDGLKALYDQYSPVTEPFRILSMGMSADYTVAVEAGSTLVRIGSLLFGKRGEG